MTRDDLRAIYREFTRERVAPPPTVDEFFTYLVGAVRPISPLERRRRSIAMTNVPARRRAGVADVLGPRQILSDRPVVGRRG